MTGIPPDQARRKNRRYAVSLVGPSLLLVLASAALIYVMHMVLHEITGFSSWPQAICFSGLFVLLVWQHTRYEGERDEDFDDE